MWGAIIGAAGSLIGGAMQNKAAKNAANQERSWAVEDQAEQFVRLRAAAEKAGFNPLTALGAAPNSGMVNPTSAARQDFMGSAIQSSALMLADSMAKTNAAATGKKLQNANRANVALSSKLTAATLRPKMAGVFDRPSKFGIGANGNSSNLDGGVPVSRLPLGPNPYDMAGKKAGIWVSGAFIPRPLGYSSGNDIENELGDTAAAELAVVPLSTAYTAASVPILAHQARLVELNTKNGKRGLPKDYGGFKYWEFGMPRMSIMSQPLSQ